MAEDAAVLSAHHVHDYDAIVVASRAITADTIAGAEPPVLIARLGVGYDSVDVPACTERGVILTITPDGVRRPMASSCMAFILALGHQLMRKDRMTREGRWADADRYEPMGAGLVDRVLGLVGMGNIGREVFKLAKPIRDAPHRVRSLYHGTRRGTPGRRTCRPANTDADLGLHLHLLSAERCDLPFDRR